ncbi:MAG: hypothetical protein ACYC9O_10855 [Candidatus Latescibacterota bacterium]
MTVRFRPLMGFLIPVFVLAVAAGCNIFDFASDEEAAPVDKAEDAIREGDYARAIRELTDENGALRDSTDSMALYTYSKAVLLESGLSIAEIVDLVQEDDGTAPSGRLALLEEIDGLSFAIQTSWYRANTDIAARLAKIWNNQTKGQVTRDDIALDYTIAHILSGILSLRDTNRDNQIDSGDFQINLSEVNRVIGGSPVSVFDFSGINQRNAQGDVIATFNGLTAFLGTPVSPGRIAKLAQGIAGYTPDDINPLVAALLEYLAGGDESIEFLIDTIAAETSYDPEDIREYIRKIAPVVNFYWYDDGVDNDEDGRTDEETINGVDDDNDGFIDEDSHYMAAYDSTNTRNTQFVALWDEWRNR